MRIKFSKAIIPHKLIYSKLMLTKVTNISSLTYFQNKKYIESFDKFVIKTWL